MFRIQKILLAEFEEIYEPVLIENPFTLVNEYGQGLRQYHIGLTNTKLFFGCDDFECTVESNYLYLGFDPEIETFELVSMLPLEFTKINFFRRKGRETMRIVVTGDEERPMLFEFGGHLFKNLFWNTWRERISTLRLMKPEYFCMSYASPFASTDILVEDEYHKVVVHPPRKSVYSVCPSSISGIS